MIRITLNGTMYNVEIYLSVDSSGQTNSETVSKLSHYRLIQFGISLQFHANYQQTQRRDELQRADSSVKTKTVNIISKEVVIISPAVSFGASKGQTLLKQTRFATNM